MPLTNSFIVSAMLKNVFLHGFLKLTESEIPWKSCVRFYNIPQLRNFLRVMNINSNLSSLIELHNGGVKL